MKFHLTIMFVAVLVLAQTPAWAQSYGTPQQPNNNNGQATVPVVPAPMQALGNVIRNPEAPPPRPPTNPTGEPPLPSALPPRRARKPG